MLNMYQFVEFLKYLKENPNQENKEIYEDITEVRDPYRAEWIDAKFSKEGRKLMINYHKLDRTTNYSEVTEPLQDCLTVDREPGISLDEWINNHNNQGLPKPNISKGDLYYWHPRNDYVARFGASSGGADLNCVRDPGYSNSRLGVRAAKISV